MENGTPQPEILEVGTLERLTSAERKSQIELARQFPRQISTFKKRATEMATADEETAASCFYSMPRAGSTIEGPSVRLAEIVASAWGNLRAQARVIETTATHVVAEGTVWDLETNVAIAIENRRRITSKNGSRYSEDMITVTGNAACAIAFRNAVFKVVPATFVQQIYEDARRVAVGDASTIGFKRKQWIDYAAKFGITAARVCDVFDCMEVEDLTLDDLKDIAGRLNAIKEGEISVDESFPEPLPGNGPKLPDAGRFGFGKKKQQNGDASTDKSAAKPPAEKASEASKPAPAKAESEPAPDKKPDTAADNAKALDESRQRVQSSINAGQDAPAETVTGTEQAPLTAEQIRAGTTPTTSPPKAAGPVELLTKNHGAGVAKSMIATTKTIVELDALVVGDTRKTIVTAHGEQRQVILAAIAKAELGGEPPHNPETGEVSGDEPPALTDADIPH